MLSKSKTRVIAIVWLKWIILERSPCMPTLWYHQPFFYQKQEAMIYETQIPRINNWGLVIQLHQRRWIIQWSLEKRLHYLPFKKTFLFLKGFWRLSTHSLTFSHLLDQLYVCDYVWMDITEVLNIHVISCGFLLKWKDLAPSHLPSFETPPLLLGLKIILVLVSILDTVWSYHGLVTVVIHFKNRATSIQRNAIYKKPFYSNAGDKVPEDFQQLD